MKILVTGAAKRVGRSLINDLVMAGHKVIIHYNRSHVEAEELLAEIGGEKAGHTLVQCDLSSPQSRREMIKNIVERQGKFDVLINNASTFFCHELASVTPEQVQENFNINFFAPFELMQEFNRYCQEGLIINFLDRRVINVDPEAGTYAFAKKSLRDATEACALAWAPKIRVNGIAPGVLLPPTGNKPELWDEEMPKIPMGSASGLDEIGRAVCYLLESKTVTGDVLFVDGGMSLR